VAREVRVPDPRPALTLELSWNDELRFTGRTNALTLGLDSAGVAGPSPVQALAFGLAGCMAMDVVHMLQKGRADLKGLLVTLHGWRADEAPRRFVEIQVRFTLKGNLAAPAVERAIAMSREKYCSVWHSMRQDIVLDTLFEIVPDA
jgi:putative redox protein